MSDDGTTVTCPVEGCAFRDTASLVAVHVNGSEAADHDWDALRFGGPRDFLQQARRGWLNDEDDGDDSKSSAAEQSVASDPAAEGTETGDADDSRSAAGRTETAGDDATDTGGADATDPGPIPVGEVRCPADGCHYTGELASVKAHISGTHDSAHDSDRLRERGIYPDVDDVKGGVDSEASADSADNTTTTDDTATTATMPPTFPATTPDATELAGDNQLSGDTTVAELLDLLDAAESQDVPVDTSAVETALVFCDLLSDLAADPDTRTLVDAYTLASDLSSAAGDARTDLRDELLARTDTDGELAGDIGTVRRLTRTRRSMKDDEAVLARLRGAGVDETTVLRPDSTRVRETLDAADLPESLAFDVSESSYVQKSDSDADAKRARLAALRRRSEG